MDDTTQHPHQHTSHTDRATEPGPVPTEQFWEDLYNDPARVMPDGTRIWSGRPNDLLVRTAADLDPGTALDIGCGEGGDAVWLAERGWQVTGVDVSPTALRRATEGAAQRGVGDRVRWERVDLEISFPAGSFDLVSACYFHSPVAGVEQREVALRRAAAAVAPGGRLLVAGHFGWPEWVGDDHPDVHFPTTQEVLAALRLDLADWTVEVEEVVERKATSPEGQLGSRTDNILLLRRAGQDVGC